jgi:hypothetical protein
MSQRNYIKLSLDDHGDSTCELFVEFETDGFSGASSGYVGISQIEEFAQKLFAYPLPTNELIKLEGGHGNGEINISIKFYSISSTGKLGCSVHTVTPSGWAHRPESQLAANGELTTGYNELEKFAKELQALVANEKPFAELNEEA